MTRRHMSTFAVVLALVAGPALAQNHSEAVSPSTRPQGDPNGAVRALGSADSNHGKGTVTVPDIGTGGEGRAGGPPRDTAR